MNLSDPSFFSQDRDLLSRLFLYDQDRHVWVYPHDDQVFRVMAACAKLNVPCRNVPKDDPSTVEITNEDWDRIFTMPSLVMSTEPLSQEVTMKNNLSSLIDKKFPLQKNDNPAEATVRYYRFDDDNKSNNTVAPEAETILMAAESQMTDDEEQDMETALHDLAERTIAIIPEAPQKDEEGHDTSFLSFSTIKTEEPEAISPSSDDTKEPSMIHNEPPIEEPIMQTKPVDIKPLETKNVSDLSSWEQVLEERESTLAAREKVLRMRQKDIQDMEERLHEERKAFNTDYEEKKAFLEDKEQRMKKIFDRIEEVAYEFRRNTRAEVQDD